ncbi:MAG: hypothetical protein ACP5QU_00685 [Anaerolineae bacterium]
MHIGEGEVAEIYWQTGKAAAKIFCPASLIPAPGQYVIGHDGSDFPLPVSIFPAGFTSGGFLAAPPLPATWRPGTRLTLRGPLGRGFSLPSHVRRLALLAMDGDVAPLLALLPLAFSAGAAVTLVTPHSLPDLPAALEIQPLHSLPEILAWADYLAVHVERAGFSLLRQQLQTIVFTSLKVQILIRTPMPCGALAGCGVCAVSFSNGWKMVCKDGPVFDWQEIG